MLAGKQVLSSLDNPLHVCQGASRLPPIYLLVPVRASAHASLDAVKVHADTKPAASMGYKDTKHSILCLARGTRADLHH